MSQGKFIRVADSGLDRFEDLGLGWSEDDIRLAAVPGFPKALLSPIEGVRDLMMKRRLKGFGRDEASKMLGNGAASLPGANTDDVRELLLKQVFQDRNSPRALQRGLTPYLRPTGFQAPKAVAPGAPGAPAPVVAQPPLNIGAAYDQLTSAPIELKNVLDRLLRFVFPHNIPTINAILKTKVDGVVIRKMLPERVNGTGAIIYKNNQPKYTVKNDTPVSLSFEELAKGGIGTAGSKYIVKDAAAFQASVNGVTDAAMISFKGDASGLHPKSETES